MDEPEFVYHRYPDLTFPCVLPQSLLSLIFLCLVAFLTLNHAYHSAHLLLVGLVPFPFFSEPFSGHEVGILSQLTESALSFFLVLSLKLAQFRPLPVGIVVRRGIVRFFEFGDRSFNWEGAMVMERQWLAIAQSVSVALTGSYEGFLEMSLGPHQYLLTKEKRQSILPLRCQRTSVVGLVTRHALASRE